MYCMDVHLAGRHHNKACWTINVWSYRTHIGWWSETDLSELGGMASFPQSFTYIEVRTSLRNIIPNIILILDYPAPVLLSADYNQMRGNSGYLGSNWENSASCQCWYHDSITLTGKRFSRVWAHPRHRMSFALGKSNPQLSDSSHGLSAQIWWDLVMIVWSYRNFGNNCWMAHSECP